MKVSTEVPFPERSQPTSIDSMEISVKGEWVRVSYLRVHHQNLIVSGRWLKIASMHDEDWLETGVTDPEACIQALKNCTSSSLKADVFTFNQKLPNTKPLYPYYMEWESVAAIPLTSFKDWWEGLPQESRKNVRRSQKRGVEIKVRKFDDEMVRQIVEVNNDSPIRQRGRFAHYGKSFDEVKKDHRSFLDCSDFVCAYLGEEIIGFLKLVYRNDIASVLQLLPKASHADKRPANAMVTKAVELCEKRGMKYITYGLFNYGNKRDSPLREFKIRNGFQEVLVPRYYIPLTARGRVCMTAKLHRGLIGILPHGLITAGVNLRSKWYNFKSKAGPV
jgi:hypothetical protein